MDGARGNLVDIGWWAEEELELKSAPLHKTVSRIIIDEDRIRLSAIQREPVRERSMRNK